VVEVEPVSSKAAAVLGRLVVSVGRAVSDFRQKGETMKRRVVVLWALCFCLELGDGARCAARAAYRGPEPKIVPRNNIPAEIQTWLCIEGFDTKPFCGESTKIRRHCVFVQGFIGALCESAPRADVDVALKVLEDDITVEGVEVHYAFPGHADGDLVRVRWSYLASDLEVQQLGKDLAQALVETMRELRCLQP